MAGYNVTDAGYIQAAEDRKQAIIIHATIDAAIQTALHLWTRKGKLGISDMQNEIAKRKIKLAEQIHEHAKKFWPYEKALVDDAFGLARQNPEYNALSTTWTSYADTVNEAYRNAFEDLLEDKCLVLTPCERANWFRNQQKDRAQITYFADRVAENRADALNDQRYSRQYSVLSLGRGHLTNSVSFLDASGLSGKGASGALLGLIGAAYGEYGYYRAQPWDDNEETPEVSQDSPAMTGNYGTVTAGETPTVSIPAPTGYPMTTVSSQGYPMETNSSILNQDIVRTDPATGELFLDSVSSSTQAATDRALAVAQEKAFKRGGYSRSAFMRSF